MKTVELQRRMSTLELDLIGRLKSPMRGFLVSLDIVCLTLDTHSNGKKKKQLIWGTATVISWAAANALYYSKDRRPNLH